MYHLKGSQDILRLFKWRCLKIPELRQQIPDRWAGRCSRSLHGKQLVKASIKGQKRNKYSKQLIRNSNQANSGKSRLQLKNKMSIIVPRKYALFFHRLSILERATDHGCINNCNHQKGSKCNGLWANYSHPLLKVRWRRTGRATIINSLNQLFDTKFSNFFNKLLIFS